MTYLTPLEVAQLLQVSPKTVSRWRLTDPTFPAIQLPGRLMRVEAGALTLWLAHRGRKVARRATQVAVSTAKGT